MKARIGIGSVVVMCVLALPSFAGGKENIQSFFSDAAHKVKATANPAEKRQILSSSFETISAALGLVRSLPLVSREDIAGIDRLKSALQEKQDELAGASGYTRVPDSRLDAFSDYVFQDMEQADQLITISLVTLLLIVILIVLIVR